MKILGIFEVKWDEIVAVAKLIFEGMSRLRVPKNSKDKIGIVVAIRTENDKEKSLLESDFIRQLDRRFQNSDLHRDFKIISFPQSLVCKLNSPSDAERFLRRARAHLIIYGDMVMRQISSTENYVFRLNGLVLHRPVPLEIRNKLSREFSEFLPQQLTFKSGDELFGFQFTKDLVGLVVQYIVGIASMLSLDFNLSYRLFCQLKKEVGEVPHSNDVPVIAEMRKRIQERTTEVLHSILMQAYAKFAKDRKRDHIVDCDEFISVLLGKDPSDYQATLCKAMRLFFLGRVDDAISTFDGFHNKDVTWRFSLGFLYAFKGDTDEALAQYQKAWYGTTEPNLINDVDIFITEAISECPEKIQLTFFRGLVNFKGKPDYELAKADFEAFLKSSSPSDYPRLRQLAERYLGEIKSHLGI